tara:strand:- start:663 stop:1325 length:663 start_codon:yes stop_codon:yes gene_type:complete
MINNIYYPIISIPLIDFTLCKCFGNKARWFQLHSAINFLIVYIIKDDVYNLLYSPYKIFELKSYDDLYYICYLHLYHILFFKNSRMDYFHHIFFVFFGALPIYYFYNLNVIRLATFSGCGLPGAIEYFTLSLVKNNNLHSIRQKVIMSYIYNYFRYPFGILASSIIYYNHSNGLTHNISNNIIFYVILMIYLNSGFYNKLIIENTIHTYHKINKNYILKN